MPGNNDPYQEATPKMLDLALNTSSVKTVIISGAYPNMMLNQSENEARLRKTLQRFVDSGRQVIWVNDLPWLDFEPRACIRRGKVASSQTRSDCSLPRATYELKQGAHNVIVAKVLKDFPQVQVFDTAAQLCDVDQCKVMHDDVLMYRDTHHLSYRGDLWMGERFARQQQALRGAKQ